MEILSEELQGIKEAGLNWNRNQREEIVNKSLITTEELIRGLE